MGNPEAVVTKKLLHSWLQQLIARMLKRMGREFDKRDAALFAIAKEIKARDARTDTRIEALEKQVAESTSRLQYRGIWREGTGYQKGNFATDHGSLWACMTDDSKQRPGEGSEWVLAAKGAQR